NEIKFLAGASAVRQIEDAASKGVFILRNYCGPMKLTIRGICSYWNLNRDIFKRRVWNILLGHSDHSMNEPRYLAPFHEARLGAILDRNQKSNNSTTKDDFIT